MPIPLWLGVSIFGAVIAWYCVDRARLPRTIMWRRSIILTTIIIGGALDVVIVATQSALLVYALGLLIGTIGHLIVVDLLARQVK